MTGPPADGLLVDVYRNLTVRSADGLPVYSVRDVASGLVVARVGAVVLRDAVFRVSQAGRARVLVERRKNVHAVVRGTVAGALGAAEVAGGVLSFATYDPYVAGEFRDRATGIALSSARLVLLGSGGIMYVPDEHPPAP